jgi:hypothetical protein
MSARNKKKARFPLKYIVGMLAVVWIALSFLLQRPPASWFQESIHDAPQTLDAESQTPSFPEKPPFRFGSRALADVCSKYGLDADSITRELEGFAIKAKPEWSIKRIAGENDMEQEALFEVIRELSLHRLPSLDMLD